MVWRGAGNGRLSWLVRQRPPDENGGMADHGLGDAADDGTAGASEGRTTGPGGVPLSAGPARSRTSSRAGEDPRPTDVPRWLRMAASWGWRLLLLGTLIYVLARIAAILYLVVVPCAAALLLTALLHPLEARLRRRGLRPLAATWCTLLVAIIVLAGAAALAAARVQAEYPALVAQLHHTAAQVQSWLAGAPFHLKTGDLDKASGGIVKYLSQHQSLVEGTVVTGGRIAAEILAGVVLTFFVTFFLIKDGRRIWVWIIHRMRAENRERVDLAGRSAWVAVEYYVRGTVAVAAIHALVIGILLTFMSAPLAVPIALFMFLAAFVPLVGVLVAGALAVLVTLAAKGWLDAVIVLGVLILMNQLEGHVLQPQIVGKMVRLHPLAVILVLAVGGVVAGIAGAVVAVPITAALTRAIPVLRGDVPVPAAKAPGPAGNPDPAAPRGPAEAQEGK